MKQYITVCNTSIWARRARHRRERPQKVHITLCYVHDVAVKIPDRPKSAAAAFEKYENSLGMQHRTLSYIHNGAKIIYILRIVAYFQRTCFRAAFSGLCSPLGRDSVQKIQKLSLGATQNSFLSVGPKAEVYGRSRRFLTYGYSGWSLRPFLRP